MPIAARSPHRSADPPRSAAEGLASGRARQGFSLAELLVGLVLLTIGLIGTAGTATVLARHAAAALRSERATSFALSTIAELRARGCKAGAGTRTDGPITLSWEVQQAARSGRADVTVTWPHLDGSRVQRYSAAFLC